MQNSLIYTPAYLISVLDVNKKSYSLYGATGQTLIGHLTRCLTRSPVEAVTFFINI